MQQSQFSCRNHLLRTMAPEDFRALAPLLEEVPLTFRLNLGSANVPLERVCFPERGIVSVVATSPILGTMGVGVVGHEGMTGLALMMGEKQSPENTDVQVPGWGHWIEAQALSALLETCPTMRQQMLGYVHAFGSQIAQTALANGRARIDVRLARWLLMAADRIGSVDMPLTHELLALMLGVRRPGVTESLHRLEGDHMIRARRSSITIHDRGKLEAMAGGAYGIPEREYRRILGSPQCADEVDRPTAAEIRPHR